MFLSQKLTEDNKDAEFQDDYDDLTLSDKEIKVFNKQALYWNNDLMKNWASDLTQARTLFNSHRPIIRIELQDNIVAVYDKNGEIAVAFEYNKDDWLLDNYKENQKRQLLRHLVFETEPLQKAGSMLLSLAYLDNYRGLHHQIIDFDHRYVYHRENNTFEKNADGANKIPHFYGKSVYSLSCIVGKNATGKTSIVDFLRESFLKFLKYLEEQIITCNNGYVNEEEYIQYELLDPGAKFTIIFSLGEQSYYLTNIDEKFNGAEIDGVEPFSRKAFGYASELIKIAYFSNQLRNDQKDLLLDEQEEKSDDEEKQRHREPSKTNRDFRIADYSEKRSFILKRRALEAEKRKERGDEIILDRKGINKDICYQLYYLKDKLCNENDNYIDIKSDDTLKLVSILGNKNIAVISLDAIKREEDFLKYLKEFALLPDAVIEHFSTGQYAKFSFLAKLHWFLNGSKEAIQQCNNLAGDYVFSNEDVLQEGETAILFIDEGETYYHPEWQRRYIKHLLDMVNDAARKVQIIVTTNSPFMISDILNDDITYLSDDKEGNEAEKRKNTRTLGQNIHTLLKDNFFMKSTIGEYSKELIETIISCLQTDDQNMKNIATEKIKAYFGDIEIDYNAIRLLIEQIGEPLYKIPLTEMLENSPFANLRKNDARISELEEVKRKIQEEIDALKERN